MSQTVNTPAVGTPATEHLPQDKLGHVVVSVSPTGKRVGLARLREPGPETGHAPAGTSGGWPVWDHVYTQEELERLRVPDAQIVYAHRDGRGRYRIGGRDGSTVTFGHARFRRDASY